MCTYMYVIHMHAVVAPVGPGVPPVVPVAVTVWRHVPVAPVARRRRASNRIAWLHMGRELQVGKQNVATSKVLNSNHGHTGEASRSAALTP